MRTALAWTNAPLATTGVKPLIDQTRNDRFAATFLRVMNADGLGCRDSLRSSRAIGSTGTHPTQTLALRNIRIHGESSPQSSGCQDICTVRNTRSGCGMRIVKRPSAVVNPVMPPREPLGLYGYRSVAAPR